jgi:peptidoglycan/xylan/chitin deacetylase (PgdA/CDA1 family)
MVASGLVEVGSHTRHHTRLSKVADKEILREEVNGSLDDILSRFGDRPCTFCYPNGDRSEDAEQLVRARYVGACTVERGWNTVDSDPFSLKRIGIHEDVSYDRARFLARLSGWI